MGIGGVMFTPADVLPGLLIPVLVTVLLLRAAVRELPRQIHREARRPKFLDAKLRRSSIRFWRREPVAGLVAALAGTVGFSRYNVFLRAFNYSRSGADQSLIPVAVWPMLYMVVYREVALSMSQLRKEGALDDVVLTPLDDKTLGVAVWHGYMLATRTFFAALLFAFVPALFWVPQPLHVALVPVVIAQHCAVVAIACWGGTMPERLNGIGVWPFWALLLIGLLGPPSIFMWHYAVYRYSGESNMFFDQGIFAAQREMLEYPFVLIFSAVNVVLFAAATVVFVRLLGKRLRRRRLFEFERGAQRATVVREQEAT